MSVAYHSVGWNRQKRLYDGVIGGLLLLVLLAYAGTVFLFQPLTTAETFIIRFTAIAALTLLHVILAIGPLARLDPRFLPLLYNRRHLGVTMFVFAAIHGVFCIIQFHAAGDVNPLVSVLTAYRREYLAAISGGESFGYFPFEALGLAALGIFFLMAATSHDFWLKNLGPSFWKILHMLVYLAYGLVLAHVFLGALQSERSPFFPAVLGAGFVGLVGMHLAAFAQERRRDRLRQEAARNGFVSVATLGDLQPDLGHVALLNGERIALFLRGGKVFALSNVCRHQGGPLGEGRIVNGCLTCPWHGYQYKVEDGCSPPPFTEVVPTYSVQVIGQEIHVSSDPLPLGTRSEGVAAGKAEDSRSSGEFYIGWQSKIPAGLGRSVRSVVLGLGVALPLLFVFLAHWQNPVDVGAFEFGVERDFSGVLFESPLPLLQADWGDSPAGKNFLLVGAGKFGPPGVIKGKNGQRVRFKGSLIYRNGVTMIEMNQPDSFEVLDETRSAMPPLTTLGEGTFSGELVDTKCFFGVMRPATGKVHRACAVVCLSGGVPPGLLVRDDHRDAVVLLLVGAEGKPLDIDFELAARVLEVHGKLELHSGTPVLRVDSWRVKD